MNDFLSPRQATIIGLDVSPGSKLLLLLISHYEGIPEGAELPLRQLAKESGLTVRGVQRAIRTLEEQGLVRVIGRKHEDGGMLTNRYEIQGLPMGVEVER